MKNANQVLALPDQRTYYKSVQLSLPVNTILALDQEDEVFSFLEAVEGVDFSKYVRPIRSNNTKSHDRGMLIRTMLFGYMNGVNSLSELSALCRTDLRYLYLSNEERPSKMAFSRLSNDLTEHIDQIFFDVSGKIVEEMNCDTNVQYIDGTKIEANANKNTFVYKKRILNAMDRLYYRITEDIWQLNQTYGYSYPYSHRYCAYDMWNICQYLMEVMVRENILAVYGKGHRKNEFQVWYDIFIQYALKLDEYEYWLDIIGNRNSCSKTDHDATMMATKWDYYNQSGVTRACYNCQIAVSDGIIVNSEVFQDVGDTTTYQPFMEKYQEHTGRYPEYPIADAGYGSYDNYMWCVIHQTEAYIKYQQYEREKTAEFRKQKFRKENLLHEEDGKRICPKGREFRYQFDKISDKTEYLSVTQVWECKTCNRCPFRKICTKSKGNRRVEINVAGNEFRQAARERLDSAAGKQLREQRCIQAEGTFVIIKNDWNYVRIHRRGFENVENEIYLVCTGFNLMKYHHKKMRKLLS